MAEYKTLPNYEFIRDGLYIVFNGYGVYKTNVEKEIAALDKYDPFIQRVDKPAAKPKTAAKPKK
ncbi:hypothetical protein [Bacillus sonorensis]|uniref:Uncharacterized protein n=1 Tax=Bacillus sonorensis TaxID=119858 RepID=A0ABN5AI43_9BACI|nr:hypothetical protein [Bacillus sonorensis]ASB90430.1 hypothetical protein S101395_03926 [Bacillus sonorensis]RHJ13886.1 hypothetical protein DW143_04685 [Bacillus sonorensis]WPP37719.1 hypothetical protein SK061_05705 [Bacillus sonorensis]